MATKWKNFFRIEKKLNRGLKAIHKITMFIWIQSYLNENQMATKWNTTHMITIFKWIQKDLNENLVAIK
jgi:hypothetical protein